MKMKVATTPSVKMKTAGSSAVRARVGTAIEVIHVDGTPYTGEYTVTPSQEQQILETDGLLMDGNVIVNPIPSNYGLITWDGSTLMVS